MNKLIDLWDIAAELQWVIFIILCILVASSVAWNLWNFLKPGKLVQELLVRTRSWWIMCACFVVITLAHPIVTHVGLAFLSFALCREMYPLLKLDVRERNVVLVCYGVIPIQYTLAYMGMTTLFLAFIPVLMFVFIPFLLVVKGETQGIVRSISLMPYSLVAWVYGMSHLALLFQLPDIPGFTAGPSRACSCTSFSWSGSTTCCNSPGAKPWAGAPCFPRSAPTKRGKASWAGCCP